ncbi:hypothetical protein dsx2_2032 [Desulfovibrio sp. X2]|uniref:MotE family protein n=1 Tax=Desulfovibrio sp. X2 TaxID=941449 RepID=UPI00035878A2|nr:hypothetical protein [Desulfovibrio sp. X2]EPR43922.1 hypothetical protein dsx2_2032 [Desulfovibrio sp. X2]
MIKLVVIGAMLTGVNLFPLPIPELGAGVAGVKEAQAASPAQAQTPPAAQQAAPAQPAAQPQAAPAQGAKAADKAQTPPDWDVLMKKQEELNRREQSLRIMEQDVNAKLEKLSQIESRIKSMLEEAKAVKDEKFHHLVDVYSNMKAQNAAQALGKLDEKTAVKILAGMRGRQAGEILNYVPPDQAAKLSEALTKMQMPFSN